MTPVNGRRLTMLRQDRLREASIAIGFIAIYVALEWLSFIHEFSGLPVTPWNPGVGVAFALMILRDARYCLALFVGITISEALILNSSLDGPVVFAVASFISIGYGIAAVIVKRRFHLDVGLTHLRDMLLLLAAGLVASTCVTILLALTLLIAGELGRSDIWLPAFAFLVGDLIGIAVTTPLLLRAARRWRDRSFYSIVPPLYELVILVLAIVLALRILAGTDVTDRFKLFYVLFLPVVVAAIRYGLDGACIGLALTQLGLVMLLRMYGYEARVFTEFQALMLVLTLTGLIVGISVTERREADRLIREAESRIKEKEAEVARAARFTLVSGLASALAHEINQPMAAARALARSAQQLLRTPSADMERADRNLTTAISEIDLASGIVRRMREFLRRGQPHQSSIEIARLLQEILPLIRPEAVARNIVLAADLPDELPPVFGDTVQIQQVVLNLIRNAIDSIVNGRIVNGRVAIDARLSDDAKALIVSVSDNGPGIAIELADRLFQPLTTSKPEGLGLGLSICRTIIEDHRGKIWLDTSQDRMTFFRFSLPLERAVEA